MTPQIQERNEQGKGVASPAYAAPTMAAHQLMNEDQTEVLRFLSERPLHTVVMNGFIRDNGVESQLNRGVFYACRNHLGELEGVALIGHAMYLEARTNAALITFANLAQEVRNLHMIMGEERTVQSFWNYYSEGGQPRRLFARAVLLVQTSPVADAAPVPGLRLARLDDLSLIVPVHASLAFEDSGVNPLDLDADGFRKRCARRIEQDRVWVWIERGELIFKVDIVSDTPEAIYVEGIYVAPNERRKGYGSRSMSQIGRNLLKRTNAIALLVNEDRLAVQSFFQQIGFTKSGLYETIFLQAQK